MSDTTNTSAIYDPEIGQIRLFHSSGTSRHRDYREGRVEDNGINYVPNPWGGEGGSPWVNKKYKSVLRGLIEEKLLENAKREGLFE